MKLVPDSLNCEVCGVPATVQLLDTLTDTEHVYCDVHKPRLEPGARSPKWVLKRHRLSPKNACSRMLATDEDSPKHQSLREQMCDMYILGGDGAARYYLSMLTGSDQFALWNDEFYENLREYVVEQTEGAASSFSFNLETVSAIALFLKCVFQDGRSDRVFKITKADRTVETFLRHPYWTDEQVAAEVPTTVKQLKRFSDYNLLKRRGLVK
ncbi:MAG: hypothetical protein PVH19_08325 [Planctomycetia bacterium]|jgi:hypothetical protein